METFILNAELLVEEIFWRMVNKGKTAQVKVQITAKGASYKPLVEVSDRDEDDEEYYRTLILKANRQKLSRLYKNNRNVITISVRNERNLQLKLTLAGMNSAGFGRVGAKLGGLYLFTSLIAVLVCLNVAEIFFGGGVSQINSLPTADASAEVMDFSFMKFIIDIIPGNFVSPIEEGKILQVIFIAGFFGATLNSLGDKVSRFKDLLRDLNEIFIRMLTLLMLLMPPT